MSKRNGFCKWLKDIFKLFDQTTSNLDDPHDNHSSGRGKSTRTAFNDKDKAAKKAANRRRKNRKDIITQSDNIDDLYLFGASLYMMNHLKGGSYKPNEKEELYDDLYSLNDDNDLLYDDDIYNEDYEDALYENIMPLDDIDEDNFIFYD